MRSMPTPPTEVPWLRDVFPDLIWICAAIHHLGERRGISTVTRVLDLLDPLLPAAQGETEQRAPGLLSGSLTSFDLIPSTRRAEAISILQDAGVYEDAFPWRLVRGLEKYEDAPATWLRDGWRNNVQIVPESAPELYLHEVVVAAAGGQTRVATLAKAIWLRAQFKAGRIQFSTKLDWLDIMPRYPHAVTEEERSYIEPSLRAMFGAVFGTQNINKDAAQPGMNWASSFWRQNWRLYQCILPPEPHATADVRDGHTPWSDRQVSWSLVLDQIEGTFIEVHKTSDPDLYAPDRHEVLTGITYRQVRAVDAMTHYPAFWTTEHGSPILRSLVEARIVQKWLIQQDNPNLYTRFKDYGRGHLKLQLLHLREYRETLEEERQGDLDDVITNLDALVNQDRWEEFQDISIEGNFAGTDVRRMADATGMISQYRLLFAPASSNVHGEWGAIDQYVLAPCGNPLHRRHRIPDTRRVLALGPELVDVALDLLSELVADYCGAVQSVPTQPATAPDEERSS